MTVREMKASDSGLVAALLPDLGYQATASQVEARLLALREWPDQEAFIAEAAGALVGFCQVQGVRLLASEGYAEVQALAVAASHQGQGIGKQLLKQAVQWSHARGYMRVRLQSGLHREAAHRFYQAAGFARSKASYAFEVRRTGNGA